MQASLACLTTPPDPHELSATHSFHAVAPARNGSRFRVLRPHARGGLGEVFVALDVELQREVALKEIDARHALDPRSRARFLLEAEITGKLEHPGIVPVYGLGHHPDGRPYYAMRFIQGDSLKDAIARYHRAEDTGTRAVAFHQLLGRFIAVCQAIQYAHDRGVLHRDLKPGNIMLGKYGETLVVDWGLAKAKSRGADAEPRLDEPALQPTSTSGSAETLAGAALGTPAYMSPEQAAGRLDLLGPASDVYSLGATLYCLLTGRPPFEERDVGTVLQKVQRGDFPPPRQLQPDLPLPLEAICRKAMARVPQERYASARALADDLEHWLADEPVAAWPEPRLVRIGRWVRQHKPLVSGVAAALLVGVFALTVGGLWYYQRQTEATHKLAAAEQSVRHSLDRARLSREQLHAALRRPGGVQEHLNQPARWEMQLKSARAEAQRARALVEQAPASLDPDLMDRLDKLDKDLAGDRADYELAQRLEKIRLDQVEGAGLRELMETGHEYARAGQQAGLKLQPDHATQTVELIRQAPLRQQLLTAVDDWAVTAHRLGDAELCNSLLEVARLADPDPWRDQVRESSRWHDARAMAALAAHVRDQRELLAREGPGLLPLVALFLPSAEKEALLRLALEVHPEDFWLNFSLGQASAGAGRAAEAAGFFRVALALRPGTAAVYTKLGQALRAQGDLAAALEAQRKGLDIDASRSRAWADLGQVLHDQKDLEAASDAYRKALAIDRRLVPAWAGLAAVRRDQNNPSKACAAYATLGDVLVFEDKQFSSALAAYDKALALDPRDTKVSAKRERARRLLSLAEKLPGVLRGDAAPAAELLALAALCQDYKESYRAAVTLFTRAFAAAPASEHDQTKHNRYRAACAAALAAAGKGVAKAETRERPGLRRQAFTWLEADLTELDRNPRDALAVYDEMRLWQRDPRLASVREDKQLARLPAPERAAWHKLWTAVAELTSRCRARFTQTEYTGALQADQFARQYPLAMTAGKTYVIDMTSTQFDSYLRLQDEAGNVLAENDDAAETTQDARVTFTPAASGTFRITATSLDQRGVGTYTLTIRESRQP